MLSTTASHEPSPDQWLTFYHPVTRDEIHIRRSWLSLHGKSDLFKTMASEGVYGGDISTNIDFVTQLQRIGFHHNGYHHVPGAERQNNDTGETHRAPIARPNESAPNVQISATPFAWRDPASIPPRRWLYGRHYIRKNLTCSIAIGGVGKTSLAIVEALAMTSGKELLGIMPSERARVWVWNGEDPRDELDRRISAAMLHYGLTYTDVDGYLFTDVGRETPIIIATQTRNGTLIAKPVVDAVIETIKRKGLDVLIIDPFIKSHRVNENDNAAIDEIATQWSAIADTTDCAIELLHHPRKTGGAEVTVEDGRGASALLSASRSARVLNRMNKDEASKAGIETAQAWQYFRVDNGKASMAPPPEKTDWYRLASYILANGDDVGVTTNWTWPSPFEGITTHDLRQAQKAVNEGGPWRANSQASGWVGKPIAKALNLDLRQERDRKKVAALLATWIENGMFAVVDGLDENRVKRSFVEVGTWHTASDETGPQIGRLSEIKTETVSKARVGTACVLCHRSNSPVFNIKRTDEVGGEPETLHKGCAQEWFQRGDNERF